MADLDAELLALADGDSSDAETTEQQPTIRLPSRTPSPSRSGDPRASITKSAGQKKASKPKNSKKANRDDSEEEGEASSGPESLDSAPMSESDADVGSPGSHGSGPIFPVENQYLSEKDKSYVLGLPEVEREALLADRAATVERKHQDNILKRLYQGYKDKDDKSKSLKKRKAGNADLEDGERKSSRQRTLVGGRKVGETSAAMEAYMAQREQKGILAEQRKADAADRKAGRGRRNSLGESDVDADGESEVEWDEGRTKPSQAELGPRFDEPAELIDYNRVMVGRSNFAHVCFYPGFEETVKDCYVRVNIGGNPTTGESLYRMAKITGTVEGKPYAIEGSNGKFFVTSQYVKCSMGKTEREYPFIFCSMTRFNERELSQYKSVVTNDAQQLPKKNTLISKIDQINRLVNRSFTEAELQEKLRRSGVLQQKANTIERQTLEIHRQAAENNHDADAVAEIEAKMKALEGPKLAFGTCLHKPKDNTPRGKSQQERLAELNRANRKANTRDIRKAQLAERKAQALHRAAVERGEASANPFARVKVMAKTHYDVNVSSTPKAKTPVPGSSSQPDSSKPSTPIPTPELKAEASLKKTGEGTFDWAQYDPMTALGKLAPGAAVDGNGERKSVFKRKLCDDEILANMDFGLDLDIEVL